MHVRVRMDWRDYTLLVIRLKVLVRYNVPYLHFITLFCMRVRTGAHVRIRKAIFTVMLQ